MHELGLPRRAFAPANTLGVRSPIGAVIAVIGSGAGGPAVVIAWFARSGPESERERDADAEREPDADIPERRSERDTDADAKGQTQTPCRGPREPALLCHPSTLGVM